ncbi:MAG: GNAT family N-acetyltransferase [Cyanobacteria bacterium]|nr:GNAT family N-acetyltransferase [Cyanobacteria bacterium GSL.Bin1]
MNSLEIRAPHSQELSAMYYQRWTVLRQPLGKSPGSERDRADEAEGTYYAIAKGKWLRHIALIEGKIIGSARLRLFEKGIGSIAYVAVLPEFSRQGIGSQLMEFLLNLAQEKGLHTIRLRSRVTAQSFYKKLGFSSTTEPFIHIGIPHVDMKLSL